MQFKVGDLVEDTFLEEVGIIINAWLGTVGEERVELLTPNGEVHTDIKDLVLICSKEI
tara:strand:+ start:257 stop:430 length:174 start_codon:yes stop_codon:yes gene_type:complete